MFSKVERLTVPELRLASGHMSIKHEREIEPPSHKYSRYANPKTINDEIANLFDYI